MATKDITMARTHNTVGRFMVSLWVLAQTRYRMVLPPSTMALAQIRHRTPSTLQPARQSCFNSLVNI